MPYIRASTGLRLYFEETGAGPPVLLMDGLGAMWVWYKTIPALSRYFRVIALDTRGSGFSDKPPGPYDVPTMARETVDVMAQLGLGPTHLIGLSLGGQIALEIALTYPGAAAGLVPVGITPGGRLAFLPSQDTLARMIPVSWLTPEQNFLRNISAALSPEYLLTHPAEVEAIGRMAVRAPTPLHARLAIGAAGTFWSGVAGRGERLPNPVLILNGERDRIAPLPNAFLLAGLLPRPGLHVFPESGHLCQIEQPDAFNRLVTEFLMAASARLP